MKKIFTRKNIWIILILIGILAFIIVKVIFGIAAIAKRSSTPNVTEVTQTEDLTSLVDELVEQKLAERLSQEANNSGVDSSYPVVSVSAPQEVPEVSTVEAPNSIPVSSDGNLVVIVYRNDVEYDLIPFDDAYKSAFYNTFFTDKGMDMTISVNKTLANVTTSFAFIQEDRSMSDFTKAESIGFESTDFGATINFSFPENPFGVGYNTTFGRETGVCAIIGFETKEGDVKYISLAY